MTVCRRFLPRFVVLVLAACLTALAGWTLHRRVELFQIPLLWRKVQKLEDDLSAHLAVENRGLSASDVALSRLIRFQHPEFLGGKGFRLIRLRGRDCGNVVVAVYDPMTEDFERPVGPDEVAECVLYLGVYPETLQALDASGRVLGAPLQVWVWQVVPEAELYIVGRPGGPSNHDVLRIATNVDCAACLYGADRSLGRLEISVDQRGLAVHGIVSADDLAAPLCPRRHDRPHEAPGPDAAAALATATTPGDLHRALGLIERGGESLAFLAQALLSDPDPLIRARAAILTAGDPDLAGAALRLLDDPDSRVRAAAILAARRTPGWEERLLPLRSDPHPLVARRAHLELVHSSDPHIAGPTLLHLFRQKE